MWYVCVYYFFLKDKNFKCKLYIIKFVIFEKCKIVNIKIINFIFNVFVIKKLCWYIIIKKIINI